ncbi:MAG: hypothetical protein COU32_04080 [Candidatus Magasanikbacteria bacterium CG10_big_fil_rev_8_21_14_0_10_42_10]|uniref:Uncharacterized protein n=2 Tax=Candidatus Magasanikiibacteriota TaxID=1752731 RepID=A0A2H0TX50_9BACT|nr:MAG: hypothetical protein COU32_04080 [Candidatus Magasanikbacteria bacterium CG10_big_fil_rev_8_21_14_0_10_42_10]PIZ94315.1 MAG: hypothetical protein COX82_01020 [Candidatus Magasanikbacteria bacterium CG_4_10_14_0_2_um_filter_41_10]
MEQILKQVQDDSIKSFIYQWGFKRKAVCPDKIGIGDKKLGRKYTTNKKTPFREFFLCNIIFYPKTQ